ncbi:DUF1178 family protein [Marivita sp. GX14005]|uniref:DUF1178 family protein n=1 Tax=Marivita sp. GX14005 TaxID=2942276 RepID=UPI00201A16A8|nr:DUF1178 family protein [Marivita sp. GX14005]MCL3880701.1 DUF1178 family protein [Marivita sp. GX14005]
MIQFTLKCANDHRFESWFQSGSAFDKLQAAGMVGCSVCGSTDVSKAMMAPRVGKSDTSDAPAKRSLSRPAGPVETALSAMRKFVEKNSDYVGKNFATEARAIHDGAAPDRPIWGEAKREEARKLIEDGVPVAPLPFTPTRKTN